VSHMRYFFIGMFVMLIVIKPQVLAGVAQGIANAFDQPRYPYPTERGNVVMEDSLNSNERVAGQGDMWLLEKYNELSKNVNQANSNTTSSQPSGHSLAKVAAFQKALNEQEILERFVNYTGDDPIVRKRLGLSPVRITTIEQFEYGGDDTYSVNSFNNLFNTRFKN